MVPPGIRLTVLVIAASFAMSHAGDVRPAERPPNIVFILADDLGIMDVGAYATHLSDTKSDELFYETPNIDALVRRGIAFSQAYANQLCSPTRAAILTGRIAPRLGVTTATPRTRTYYNQGIQPPPGYSPHDAFAHEDPIEEPQAWRNAHSNTAVSPHLPTLPKVLATHDSAYLGKWHLGGHGGGANSQEIMGLRRSPTSTRVGRLTSAGGTSGTARSPTTPRCHRPDWPSALQADRLARST